MGVCMFSVVSKASREDKSNLLTIKACLVNVHVIYPDHHTARS